MAEKLTGLRFQINVGDGVDSCQFLDNLKKKMNQDLPKFEIHKIALESNWQSASEFVCLVHSKKVQTMKPNFMMEFDGFRLHCTKNTKTVKFERALGKKTIVYVWNEEKKGFIRRDDETKIINSNRLQNLPEAIKKQKTSSSTLLDWEKTPQEDKRLIFEELLEKFEEKAIKRQEDLLVNIEKAGAKRQQEDRQVFFQQLERLLQNHGQGKEPNNLKEISYETEIDKLKDEILQLKREKVDLKDQIRALQVQRGFQPNSKFLPTLLNEVETLKKELANEQKKNWLGDEQINAYISKLMETNTSANLCQTHCFELIKREILLKSSQKEEILMVSGLKVEAEYALMPVNYPENHWALLLWKIADCQLFYFDSFGWTAEKTLFPSVQGSLEVCLFLIQNFSNKKAKRRVKVYDVHVPVQINKEDCGPLILVMMERLIQNDGKQIKTLNPDNCKDLFCDWFDPADEAYYLRKKLRR